MYKNILCAVDISSESDTVLDEALILAEKYDATLSVIHIIDYGFLPRDYQKKLKEDTIPKITKLAEKYHIAKKHCHVKFGQPYTQICQLAKKKDIDLIILGSHGKHGLRALLGSTANGVANHAHCNVMVIKIS